MSYTEQDKTALLEKLRTERAKDSPDRIQLIEVFEYNGNRLPRTILEWKSYDENGKMHCEAVSDAEYDAAKSLLREKGDLVRTFEESFDGLWKKTRLIERFEDLKFGFDGDDVIVFNFSPTDVLPDPVVRLDKIHRSAISRVKDMVANAQTLVIQPIRLTQGTIVMPVTINRSAYSREDVAEMIRRQTEFKP